MSTSSAADWCRAVLQEVTPSPINNIPLPVQGHVPPPPPPEYATAVKKSAEVARTSAAASVAQPSAQYQAYYNQYYQQAYAAPAAAAAATASATTRWDLSSQCNPILDYYSYIPSPS